MMQNHDSRLRKAASRTIRAEATLVIVILLITSWSVYGLYKLSIGASDSIFGFTFSKASSRAELITNATEQDASKLAATTDSLNSSGSNGLQRKSQPSIYSPGQDGTHSDQIYQQLSAAQRDNDYASFKGFTSNQSQFRDMSIDPERFRIDAENSRVTQGGRQLPEGYENLLSFQREQRQQRALDLVKQQHQPNRPILLTDQPSLMQLSPPITRVAEQRAAKEVTPADLLNFNMDDDYKEEPEDRVPAESSRDTTESVANQDDEDSSKPETTTEEAQPDLETTTETPNGERDQEAPGANQEEQASSETAEPEEGEEQPSTTTEEPDRMDDESLREAGHNIDEEVDRMTQPSSGSTSRQEKPREYKNTVVQFDDLPNSTTSPDAVKAPSLSSDAQSKPNRSVVTVHPPDVTLDKPTKVLDHGRHDLQVVPNRLMVMNDSNKSSSIPAPQRDPEKLNKRLRRRKVARRQPNEELAYDHRARHKRSNARIESIRAPYEIDQFLDSLDFESLSSEPSQVVSKRQSRAIRPQSRSEREDESMVDSETDSIPSGGGAVFDEDPQPERNSTLGTTKEKFQDSLPDQEVNKRLNYNEGQNTTDRSADAPNNSRYHYLTSNDTGLQDLLNKTNLLDRYQSDELPPPIERPPPTPTGDHQAAGSLYTVDHGLILYPEADETKKHHEKMKSESKKHKKHHKMKHKKKMSIGLKKGGHKKKKHKKEMKKFIKEKKFKGAKKGKKVAKGKGGQGGKKGKKLYKDKGYKKKGFKKVYHKEEFGQKKSYFDEYRDKDFKKKWKKYDDKYNYARMKKWQAKDVKGAKKMKDHHEKYKKYDKSKWKKKYEKHSKEHSEKKSKKKKKSHSF